jgi:hypothetical protein
VDQGDVEQVVKHRHFAEDESGPQSARRPAVDSRQEKHCRAESHEKKE